MLKCLSLIPLTFALSTILLHAQNSKIPVLDWKQWSEAPAAEENSNKTLVYVYTNWCTLCKKLEQEAFTDSLTQKLIQDNFILVGLDAESRSDLQFNDKEYSYVRKGNMGYHELAADLLDGRLAFPSLVFLDQQGRVLQVIHGYQGLEHFNLLLRYYGQDHYKRLPWGSFQRQFMNGQVTDD